MNEYFVEGFEKIAETTSEGWGTFLWAPVPSAVGYAAGKLRGAYNKKEYKDAQKKGTSNVLVPGLGAYRLARGHAYNQQKKRDKKK